MQSVSTVQDCLARPTIHYTSVESRKVMVVELVIYNVMHKVQIKLYTSGF